MHGKGCDVRQFGSGIAEVFQDHFGTGRRLSTSQGAFCPYNDPSAMLQHAPGCKNHLKQSLSRAGRHTSTRLATASSTKRALFVPEPVKFIVSSTKQVNFVLEVQKKARNSLILRVLRAFLVPPLGIEPGPSEPESEILSFKLQGHPGKGTANLTKIWGLQAKFADFLKRRL